MTEQDAVPRSPVPDPMEVFKGEGAQNQGAVSTRKRAGPESIDATMKRQRKEKTIAKDVSSCGSPVHRTRQKLKPSLPTFSGGSMQASHLESSRMERHVGEAAVGEQTKESKNKHKRTASMCEHQRRRSLCKECKGSGICEHQRRRSECKECRDAVSARTSNV